MVVIENTFVSDILKLLISFKDHTDLHLKWCKNHFRWQLLQLQKYANYRILILTDDRGVKPQ